MSSNNSSGAGMGGRGLCDLTQSYSFILQSVLGVLAFSTLILKRYCEPEAGRRPFWIWLADTTKQALGMLEIHFLNLFLAALISEQECITYLVSFLLDSTVGLLIIYLLLKSVAWLVAFFDITPLQSGVYGTPFKLHYWLAQAVVYLTVMFLEKLIVGPLITFSFWKEVEAVILPWKNERLNIAIVIFIVPFVVNVVTFWVVDSLLMWKKQLWRGQALTSVHFHRRTHTHDHAHHYDKLSSSDSEAAAQPEGVWSTDSSPVYVDLGTDKPHPSSSVAMATVS